MGRRLLLVVALVLAASSEPASAALDFVPCAGTPDYACATLRVPLDPAAPTGETLGLEVRQLNETSDGRGVLVALAGGPGQGATDFIDDFAGILAEGLVDRRLIVLDQRGTGHSGALTCPALDGSAELLSLPALTARVGRCGGELGPRRRFFTTTEVVADLEALRAALGAERIALFGVSYGAYVAQRYARAFPGRVDRLVLDSPVAQDQGGPFDASSYAAASRVLRGLCGARCVADVRQLVARLPLRGTAYDARGRARPARLARAGELFDLLVSSDFSPALRAALPAAIAAAVRGDPAALLRIVAAERDDPGTIGPDARNADAEAFSNALFFATTCQEKPQVWGTPEAPLDVRQAARDRAVAALGALAPFGAAAAASTQVGTAFCLAWPPTAVAPPPAPGTIDAAALVLSGTADMRTPWEEARRTVNGIRDGTLVRVPGAGHAVVSQALPCVQRALARFFSDAAVGNPCDGEPAPAATLSPRAPRTLGALRTTGLRGRGAPLAAAALATVEDAIRTAAAFGALSEPVQAGGLRGGHFCARPGELGDGRRPLELDLRSDRYVPAVPVSGTATVTRNRLTAMTVTVRGHRLRLTGRHLRGRGVRATLTAASLHMPPLAVPAAVDATAC